MIRAGSPIGPGLLREAGFAAKAYLAAAALGATLTFAGALIGQPFVTLPTPTATEVIPADRKPIDAPDASSGSEKLMSRTLRNPGVAVPSLKDALKDVSAIAIQVSVPRPGTADDIRFLKEVGEIVTIGLKNYDAVAGRGEIAGMSFGNPETGYVIASDTKLNIVNSSPMGCAGSFERAENDVLHGKLACKWGQAYPTYSATIRLGG